MTDNPGNRPRIDRLPAWAVVGATFNEVGVPNGRTWEVRGIVDGRAVCRCKTKKGYAYEIKTPIEFAVWHNNLEPLS